jgi:hypothetical protein
MPNTARAFSQCVSKFLPWRKKKFISPPAISFTSTTKERPSQNSHFRGSFQGDQIGRIFANFAVVLLGLFLKMTEVAQIIGLIFFPRKKGVYYFFCN